MYLTYFEVWRNCLIFDIVQEITELLYQFLFVWDVSFDKLFNAVDNVNLNDYYGNHEISTSCGKLVRTRF